MNAKMDALIAEIVRIIDFNLLEQYPDFETFWRPNRMHLILASLKRCDVARAERRGGGLYWLPSRRLEDYAGVRHRGIRDEFERTEAPIVFSTDAEEYNEILRCNCKMIKKVTRHVVRCFELYQLGLLEYHGKEDGFLQFNKPSSRIDVKDEAGNTAALMQVRSRDFHFAPAPRMPYRAGETKW